MHRRKLFFIVGFATVVAVVVVGAIVWRAPLVAALPSSVQNFLKRSSAAGLQTFHETFGMSTAGDVGSGATEEIALDDGAPDPSVPTGSVAIPTGAANINDVGESKKNDGSVAPVLPASAETTTNDVPQAVTPPFLSGGDASASAAAAPSSPSLCAFPSSPPATSSLLQKIIFNEIAWMGVPSSSVMSAAQAGNAEWMELKNISQSDIDLSGWKLTNASGKVKVMFGTKDRILRGGFFLLLRGSTTLPYAPASGFSYSGDLRNTGDDLAIFDSACAISDFVGGLSGGWPAGNNATKQTMERDADGVGWHTSVNAGGTPGTENSVVLPPAHYKVIVAFQGAGGAAITSDPAGMTCTATQCEGTFIEGTKLVLAEQPAVGALFDGWTGSCSGKGKCSFVVGGDASLTATFHIPVVVLSDPVSAPPLPADAASHDDSEVASSPTSIPTSTSISAPASSSEPLASGRIVIAAVQIAGASTTNDFVKLYNPSPQTVDLGGWKLRKKSQTGADYSLREISAGSVIAPGRYFIWANNVGGFATTLGADVSSTETLSANNSVALIDADGTVVDALAWGTGTGQYGEGAPYLTNPTAGQMLTRKVVDGAMADTGNNADDFTLQ